MQNKYYILKKEDLIALLKEIQIPIHKNFTPLGDDSSILGDLDSINYAISNMSNTLTRLNKHKYYTNTTYKVIYIKIPQSPKEIDLKLTYTFRDSKIPTKLITSVSAFYIARPFIDGNSDTGVLNMGTTKEGISYLSSVKFSKVRDNLNNSYIKVEIGPNKSTGITFADMYASLFSESYDYQILDDTSIGAVTLTNVVSTDTNLEAPTLKPDIEDADKLVRSNDYKWIKALTEYEFQKMRRDETLKEDYLYTTDKVDTI